MSTLDRRLTDEEIQQIRQEYQKGVPGKGCQAIGRKYGVSSGTIWRLLHGVTRRARPSGYAIRQFSPSQNDAFVLIEGSHPYALGEDGRVLKSPQVKETRDKFVALQGGKCPICGAPPEDGIFHLDHDSRTGRPRGALCAQHNRGLGHFQHDPESLRKAIAYLGASLDDWYEDHQARLKSSLDIAAL